MKKLLLFFIYPLLYISCDQQDEPSNTDDKKGPIHIEPMITITPVIKKDSSVKLSSAKQKQELNKK